MEERKIRSNRLFCFVFLFDICLGCICQDQLATVSISFGGVVWYGTKPGFTVIPYGITCILVRRPLVLSANCQTLSSYIVSPINLQFTFTQLEAHLQSVSATYKIDRSKDIQWKNARFGATDCFVLFFFSIFVWDVFVRISQQQFQFHLGVWCGMVPNLVLP